MVSSESLFVFLLVLRGIAADRFADGPLNVSSHEPFAPLLVHATSPLPRTIGRNV